jgi:hypothetical protein
MTRDNMPGRPNEPSERNLKSRIGEAGGLDAGEGSLDIYDRGSQSDWRATFRTKRRSQSLDEQSSLYLSDPYPVESTVSPIRPQYRDAAALSQTGNRVDQSSESLNRRSDQNRIPETPARVPIAEAMMTIRSIIASVKGGASVGPEQIAAFEQLGVAAVECKAAHNLQELQFIGRVRNLLGSYLGKTTGDTPGPTPRMESAETGVVSERSARVLEFGSSNRRELETAGTLAGPPGLTHDRAAMGNRFDQEMTTTITDGSDQTHERKSALTEQFTPRTVAEDRQANGVQELPGEISKSHDSGRFFDLEQLGILIALRDRPTRSIT